MGKKQKKKGKKSKRHELLSAPDTLSLGQRLTVGDVFAQYLLPEMQTNGRRPSTIANARRAVRRFEAWWATVCDEPLPVAVIRRKHLGRFRDWLAAQGVRIPTQNEACGVLRQLLRCAERHEIIDRAPRIERLHHHGRAARLYLTFDEVDRLFAVLDRARWPRMTSALSRLPYSPGDFWRASLVMFLTYGFRTQELIALESSFRSLTWANIYDDELTPNPAGRMRNASGWLSYVPQKQERLKPEPLVNPLTPYARAALDLVRDTGTEPQQPVFDVARSSVSFYNEWHRLIEIADIKPRVGSGVARYLPKHCRKTATTWLNTHQHGLGAHVVGHASDRSGQQVSAISERHYANNEEATTVGLQTFEPPTCFLNLTRTEAAA